MKNSPEWMPFLPEKKRSNWWYLAPLLGGIIGGVCAYFALRKDDLPKAKKCLYVGIIMVVIGIILEGFFATVIFEQGYDINVWMFLNSNLEIHVYSSFKYLKK
mgnify:CR=1 FL=1